MKVLVMVASDPSCGSNLQIVMLARLRGEMRVSQIVTLKGAEPSRTGNPYLVYGNAIEEWLGCDKFNTSINVFHCRSGSFIGWS